MKKKLVLVLSFLILCMLLLLLGNHVQKLKEDNRRLQTNLGMLEENYAEIQLENQKLQKQIEDFIIVKGGVQEHGSLKLEGVRLVDQNGEPIVLRGIGSHGLMWYPEYTNYSALKTMKDYGANVFRISMYVEQEKGYLEEPELSEKMTYLAIENSLAADLYTIVDWHVLRDENPLYHLDKAKQFFENVAKRYGDEPGIIYEICNEPNGDTTYQDIVEYACEIIPLIRKYAPEAVILVGTPKFCTSLKEAMENPLPYENVMYTYHFYAGISDCKYAVKEIAKGMENGLPVFISEWGLDAYNATDEDWEETEVFLEFLDQRGISWINWSLSNKEEGYSAIQKDALSLGNWTEEELTLMGRYVKEYLHK